MRRNRIKKKFYFGTSYNTEIEIQESELES